MRSEDDLLHLSSLPDFGGALGQRDSELLLSFLTVPYLRIPLIINFFASDNRVQALKSRDLRNMLEHALVEPGRCARPTPFLYLVVQMAHICVCTYMRSFRHFCIVACCVKMRLGTDCASICC